MKGIMDALSDTTIERVVLMKSAQTGGTECSLNAIGYYIDQDPSPILMVQPTIEMGLALSKDRLAPMLRDSPVLKDRVTDVKSRDSGNTLLHKTFPGGHITIAGANSPAGLAMRPVRVLIFDEVDRFPDSAGTEGDPITLGRKRSKTFWNRKSFEISTPTVTGASRINDSYEISNQSHYHVPCPACGAFQKLHWEQVKWDKDENKKALIETAHYECEHCEHKITDKDKHSMLLLGEWIADQPDSVIAGFHINELYSPWSTFQEVVESFLEAKPKPDTLRAWVNTCLGETWAEDGDDIDSLSLFESLREVYQDPVPEGVVLLTAGADVQKDRIEAELVGWGVGFESWSIEFRVFYGDTNKPQVWEDFDNWLLKKRAHACGADMSVVFTCVDSGYRPDDVYKFCKGKENRRVFPIKGEGGQGKPIVIRTSRKNTHKVRLFTLGVDGLKSTLYARLKMEDRGAGFCHFNMNYDDKYFESLTSERPVPKYYKGRMRIEWILPSGRRNEALDCRVYNMAAIEVLNPNFERLSEYMRKNKQDPISSTPTRAATRRVISRGIG